MRNFAMLLLVGLATFKLWVFTSAFIIAPFWGIGVSHRAWLGSITFPDALEILIFAAWLFVVGRFACRAFVGPSVKRFRWATVTLAVAIFVYTRGVFIDSNLTPRFIIPQLLVTAVVAAAGIFGLRCLTRSNQVEC